jgi:uncharacterized repeat protein (TIGR03803 family)
MRIKALCLQLSTVLVLAVVSDSLHASVRLTTLCNFRNIGHPTGRLLQDQAGNFYGTASAFLHWTDYGVGYFYTSGGIFKISPKGVPVWHLEAPRTLDVFPAARLFQDEQGFLYGTTVFEGSENVGSVFKVSNDGKLVWLKSFNGLNGALPGGEIVRDCDGSFFGTTFFGGQWGGGTVFRLTREGRIRTIHNFRGNDGTRSSGLVRGVDGYFYGITYEGGFGLAFPFSFGDGTIFRMSCDGAVDTLCKFGNPTNTDSGIAVPGKHPTGELIQCNDGFFYGVTQGDLPHEGTFPASVFKFDANGTFSTLHYFDDSQGDGVDPAGPLLTGYDGSLYGVTTLGGASGYGTIFKISPSGTFLNLVSFNGTNGCSPVSGLIKGEDGHLYGTTYGDDFFPGTLFRLSILRPVLSIARPRQIVHPTNAVVTVTGQTKSRTNVLDVFYQLNGGDWTEATTTNEWKNWTATVTLSSGKNILRAYAIDSTGDLSRTNRVRLIFEQP